MWLMPSFGRRRTHEKPACRNHNELGTLLTIADHLQARHRGRSDIWGRISSCCDHALICGFLRFGSGSWRHIRRGAAVAGSSTARCASGVVTGGGRRGVGGAKGSGSATEVWAGSTASVWGRGKGHRRGRGGLGRFRSVLRLEDGGRGRGHRSGRGGLGRFRSDCWLEDGARGRGHRSGEGGLGRFRSGFWLEDGARGRGHRSGGGGLGRFRSVLRLEDGARGRGHRSGRGDLGRFRSVFWLKDRRGGQGHGSVHRGLGRFQCFVWLHRLNHILGGWSDCGQWSYVIRGRRICRSFLLSVSAGISWQRLGFRLPQGRCCRRHAVLRSTSCRLCSPSPANTARLPCTSSPLLDAGRAVPIRAACSSPSHAAEAAIRPVPADSELVRRRKSPRYPPLEAHCSPAQQTCLRFVVAIRPFRLARGNLFWTFLLPFPGARGSIGSCRCLFRSFLDACTLHCRTPPTRHCLTCRVYRTHSVTYCVSYARLCRTSLPLWGDFEASCWRLTDLAEGSRE